MTFYVLLTMNYSKKDLQKIKLPLTQETYQILCEVWEKHQIPRSEWPDGLFEEFWEMRWPEYWND